MQDIEFYDVKKRAKVQVPVSACKKTTYSRTTRSGSTQVRYAVKAEFDGSRLTKFVSEAYYNDLDVPVV